VPGVFDDFGSDIAERAGERGELLVGRVEEFGSMKKMEEQRSGKRMEDSHAEVDDDNVTVGVLGAVEDVFGPVAWVKKQREKGNQAYLRSRWTMPWRWR